jgi:hypothetical protein
MYVQSDITKHMKRFYAGFATLALIATLVAPASAGAQTTVADLQAMIAQLQAQIAALVGGGSSSAGFMFNADLTVGSTGQAVVELQKVLVAKGHLTMPAGVAMGYFGSLTKSAVAKWQASEGIAPALGYFGPLSRARLNATAGTPVNPGTTTPGGITTPGVEGTLTVTVNPTPTSGTKVYEGDSRAAVMGIKLEAKISDIRVERVKVQLPDTAFYNKIAEKIYITDNGNVLGSMDLNSSTVVKEGSNYFITVSGLNFIVPKNTTKVLTVAIDVRSSIDSTDLDAADRTITIPAEGVRGTDGAGVNQYGPSSSFSRSFNPEGEVADDATLKVSLNTNTPAAADVIASSGSDEDELDGLTLMTFDVKAEKDAVMITDLVATITRGGTTSTATSSTAYLYDGSTLIGSASVVGTSLTAMTATFTDIDYTVSKDSTKTLTLKVDIDDAGTAATTFSAAITSGANVTAENSSGDSVAETGSATGETMSIRNVGPQITLVSKTIEKSATASQNNTSTSTAKAIFTVKVKAVGGDILFGTQGTTTASNAMFTFGVYKGSTLTTLNVASTSNFTVPSGVTSSSNSFTLQENNEVTIAAEFLFEGRTVAGALVSTDTYSVGIEAINWQSNSAVQSSTFMAGETDWRTSGVALP